MIRLGALSALVLLVPGLLMIVMAWMILKGRRGAAYTLPPARASDGSAYWGAQQAQRVEQRVTETREPAPRLDRSETFQKAARDLSRANWDDACREALEWVYDSAGARIGLRVRPGEAGRPANLPASHPFNWTLVFVGGILCAVPPTGPAAHRYDSERCSWEPTSEALATCARRALGWEA